jgi:hypothetical protein
MSLVNIRTLEAFQVFSLTVLISKYFSHSLSSISVEPAEQFRISCFEILSNVSSRESIDEESPA